MKPRKTCFVCYTFVEYKIQEWVSFFLFYFVVCNDETSYEYHEGAAPYYEQQKNHASNCFWHTFQESNFN